MADPTLTHFDDQGNSQMVDVSEKALTQRVADACGSIRMKKETVDLIQSRKVGKGDVIEVARIAGIMAAKQTPNLIPMCHGIHVDAVNVDFEFQTESVLMISATVKAHDRTGVEMEALTCVSVAALTVYDMCKSVDREMTIEEIRLIRKSGGKSGDFVRS